MPLLLTLPGFKRNPSDSNPLTAMNLEQHERDLLAQKVKDLEATLALRDAENKTLVVENVDMRRKLTIASAAKKVDETETPEPNAKQPTPVKTQDDVHDSRTWRPTTNSECF